MATASHRSTPAPGFRSHLTVRLLCAMALLVFPAGLGRLTAAVSHQSLEADFSRVILPFLERHCLECHGAVKPKGDLDLSLYRDLESVTGGLAYWELVKERVEAGEMPPKKFSDQPESSSRRRFVQWVEAVRGVEAKRNAGDPGPVLARRLSHAEYDHTIHDLTGVDIRPTRTFPVDPANQAGFDNSGESLSLSPALLKKYFQAAREVAEHLMLTPSGFEFAGHPVVADTDRDKWAVFRIVDFYRRQRTDYADFFEAAWRFEHRDRLGKSRIDLDGFAREAGISPTYLKAVYSMLTGPEEWTGPLQRVQLRWRALPHPKRRGEAPPELRASCESIRDYVLEMRDQLVPAVSNLVSGGIHSGSQTLVLWKNRAMAANRRQYDPAVLDVPSGGNQSSPPVAGSLAGRVDATTPARTNRPAGNAQWIQKGGRFLAPVMTTTNSSATTRMAASARKSGVHPDLVFPPDPGQRQRHKDSLARFASLFPDAFYITERARVYLDAQKEQENAGRLLSAGLHSMTGYFRDDAPLYDLILDDAGRRKLDRLWDEFDFGSSVPQRMHTSFIWFERTDSNFLRDSEFDSYRPEDKSVTEQSRVRALGELYLAKARRLKASETVANAVQDHFSIVASNLFRVEQMRRESVPFHLRALEQFASRAWRRPLENSDRASLREFHEESRKLNGGDHEEAVRDSIVRILMSPQFLFLAEPGASTASVGPEAMPEIQRDAVVAGLKQNRRFEPLSATFLASRLSYFLWSSLPDEELSRLADSGVLIRPEVLRSQVRRMLKDRRVRNLALEFGGNWLDFRRFEEHNSVDRERHPEFDSELRKSMFEEPVRFIEFVIQENRPVQEMLYGDYTWVNSILARHYGLTNSVNFSGPDDWRRVERVHRQGRGGLLPMAVFLTANSPGLRTSPVKRGYWVVRRVLGEQIPPPPATVPELPADEKSLGELTLRETLERHRADPACAGCHARFDSFGLVFEGYDPVGGRRAMDLGGHKVDDRAQFPGGFEAAGLAGLRDHIRRSRQDDFEENLCRKLVAYALGRTLIPSDDLLIAEMRSRLKRDGNRFGSLVETLVLSPQFLNRRVSTSIVQHRTQTTKP